MRSWIRGTVRLSSFRAAVPPIVGALLTGQKFSIGLVFAYLGAVVSAGFANSFNNIIDRRFDRHDPRKPTLGITKPYVLYLFVLFLLPIEAQLLQRVHYYNHNLLAALFYWCFWYSYLFGRIPIAKRFAVATIVSATSFLSVRVTNLALWVWAIGLAGYIFVRESRKDAVDLEIDQKYKFTRVQKADLDTWCIGAPLFAPMLFLGCMIVSRQGLLLSHLVMMTGLSVSVWSYLQIRYRYGDYRMKFTHKRLAGLLGIVISLVGLMPVFSSYILLLLIWVNCASILYRAFLPKVTRFSKWAVAHDAYLWASIPLMAMVMTGYNLALIAISLAMFLAVFVWESGRLSRVQARLA